MRKIFFLIPALILAMMVNATPLGPNDPNVTVTDVIKTAVAAASADAVIELSDGIYEEEGNFAINKNITIKAAEGAHPVIAQRYYIYFNNSAKVTFKGIKFDGGAYGGTVGAYDYALRTYGSPINRDETLTLEDCEFVNYPGYNIFIERADRGLDAITIRDCYFHNNTKYAIYIGTKEGDTQQSCNSLTIENSTFANVSGNYDVIYYDAPADQHTTSLSVDHCTFYNHPKRAINWQKSTNLAVSNCVFAQPATNTYKSAECVGGTITNCLYFQSNGFSSAATRTNTIKGNPLFVDAANNDFRLNNASAARREDGSVWGDPRWATVTPAVAIPAKLNPVDAFVSDSVGVHLRANAADPDSIDFKMLGGKYDFEDMEWAKWNVSVSETGYYNFTAHVFRATSGSQKFEIKLLNSNETSELIGNTDDNVSGGEGTISTGKYELTPGEYVVKVRTLYNWAKSRVLYVDATYEGGKTITVPDTLWPADAIRSEKAWVENGTVDSLLFTPKGSEGHASDADYTIAGSQYGKWNINITKAGKYKFVANTRSLSGHNYRLLVFNEDETVKIDSVQEAANNTYSWAKQDGSADVQLSSNIIDLAVGQYVIKVQNKQDSKGRVTYVAASYEGGAIMAIPDTLKPIDAIKSERAYVNEDGELRFTDDSHDGYVREQWGKWNISAAEAGKYKFEANVNSSNGQNYRITLKNADESATIDTWYGEDNDSGERKIATELVDLTAGTYVLMIEDTVKYSHGRVVNIVASYEGGKTVNVPGQILAKEAVIGKVENGHQKMYHLFDNGDLHYGDNKYPREEFATWTIHAEEACNLSVSFDLNSASTSGHEFLIELHNNVGKIDSVEETKLTKYLAIPAAGNYTLKLINRKQWSSAILHGITFAPYVAPDVVTMNDMDLDNTAWVENVASGATVNVRVNRTILGGMYNTICLPFKVSSNQCQEIFGNDVELYTLNTATLSGDILNLQFTTVHDIWNGTPILIKTSSDIVNPLFEGVVVESATADHTNGGFATFQGTFVKTEFHAGNQVLLLLANNMLAYPQQDRTLKGFRAYFSINNTSGAPIRAARIVTPNQVPTEIDLVTMENGMMKTIENGQLIIIKNGVRYNALGVKLQ